MAGIAEAFELHELAVEDAVNAGQRPKLEQFGDDVTSWCCARPATSSTPS